MAEQNNNQQDLNQLLQVRYDKLHELQENGKDPFVITKYDVTNHSTDIIDNFETMEGKPVSIAGRMMFKRVLQYSGLKGTYSGICCKRQYRRGNLQRFQEI